MSLSPDQIERIEAALDCGDPRNELPRLVDALQTPAELHVFATNYNVNDGLRPIWRVIRHPQCDLGTAVFLYWHFADIVEERAEDRQQVSDDHRDVAGLIREIEDRVAGDRFDSKTIAFDPRAHLEWNRISEYRFQKAVAAGTLTYPPRMIDPTPGEPGPEFPN